MRTLLQESGGLRRTAPVQSPVPVDVAGRLSVTQRTLACAFVLITLLSYALYLVPVPDRAPAVSGEAPSGQTD